MSRALFPALRCTALIVGAGMALTASFGAVAQDVIVDDGAAPSNNSNDLFLDSLEGLFDDQSTRPQDTNRGMSTDAQERSDEGSLFDDVDNGPDAADSGTDNGMDEGGDDPADFGSFDDVPTAGDEGQAAANDDGVGADSFQGDLDDMLNEGGQSGEKRVVTPDMTVVLNGLDKVTGRTSKISVPVNEPITFGALTITARYCEKAPPEDTPEVSAFLQIDARNNLGEIARAFSGWMFASSPAVSALEHPVYDVWVIDCSTVAPSK